MVLVLIKMSALPRKHRELCQTVRSIVKETRKEEGCLHAGFFQNVEDEEDFLLIEDWDSQKALDEHLRSIRFKVLVGAKILLSFGPEVMIHTVSNSSELDAVNHWH